MIIDVKIKPPIGFSTAMLPKLLLSREIFSANFNKPYLGGCFVIHYLYGYKTDNDEYDYRHIKLYF